LNKKGGPAGGKTGDKDRPKKLSGKENPEKGSMVQPRKTVCGHCGQGMAPLFRRRKDVQRKKVGQGINRQGWVKKKGGHEGAEEKNKGTENAG